MSVQVHEIMEELVRPQQNIGSLHDSYKAVVKYNKLVTNSSKHAMQFKSAPKEALT
jgi:hypothetical protein